MKKKFTEKLLLNLRKKWITSSTKTFLMVAIILLAFITLVLFMEKHDLPKFDVTENKIYTLSDSSKNELKNIDQEVKLYIYGYDVNAPAVELIKQCNSINSKISYDFIDEENNLEKVNLYGLESGNYAVIIEVGEKNKILYSSDFYSYDYSTYQEIDLTENSIVNSILTLTIAEKPKIYFLTGHNELSYDQYLTRLLAYLENSIFEHESLNLLTKGSIPEDCDLIAIMSPQNDLYENEYIILDNYIKNGGNILFTSDFNYVSLENTVLPNWQKILDLYGVTIENGAIYETAADSYVSDSPFIFLPKLEEGNEVYTDGNLIMQFAKRINMAEDAKLQELGVEYQKILTSSESSFFVTDFSENAIDTLSAQTPGSSIIAAKITKKLNSEESQEEKSSKMIIIANGAFASNVESMVASGVGQINLENNSDFLINSVANLTNRTDSISVKKEITYPIYTFTNEQRTIINIIGFSIPCIIILTGIFVWRYRKHKR